MFSSSKPKSTGEENKARWTHGTKSCDGLQRMQQQIEAKRLQRWRWQGCRFSLAVFLLLWQSCWPYNSQTFSGSSALSLMNDFLRLHIPNFIWNCSQKSNWSAKALKAALHFLKRHCATGAHHKHWNVSWETSKTSCHIRSWDGWCLINDEIASLCKAEVVCQAAHLEEKKKPVMEKPAALSSQSLEPPSRAAFSAIHHCSYHHVFIWLRSTLLLIWVMKTQLSSFCFLKCHKTRELMHVIVLAADVFVCLCIKEGWQCECTHEHPCVIWILRAACTSLNIWRWSKQKLAGHMSSCRCCSVLKCLKSSRCHFSSADSYSQLHVSVWLVLSLTWIKWQNGVLRFKAKTHNCTLKSVSNFCANAPQWT